MSFNYSIHKKSYPAAIVFFVLTMLFFVSSRAQTNLRSLDVPLTDASNLTIEGPHRFVDISGIRGLLVTTLSTKAFLETSLLNSEKGTISIWMSPVEDMDKFPMAGKKRACSITLYFRISFRHVNPIAVIFHSITRVSPILV